MSTKIFVTFILNVILVFSVTLSVFAGMDFRKKDIPLSQIEKYICDILPGPTCLQKSEVDFLKIINDSKEANKEFWIPAIACDGKLYKDKGIKIISNGEMEAFVGKLGE